MKTLVVLLTILAVPPASALPPSPDDAGAEEELRGIVLAPKFGSVVPTSRLRASFIVGFEAGYDFTFLRELLGRLVPGVSLELDYLDPQMLGNGSSSRVGDYEWTLDQRVFLLSLDAQVHFDLGAFRPYTGVGYGVYFLHARMKSFEVIVTEDQVRSGLQLRFGLAFTLRHGDVFVEMRFHYTGLGFLTTGESNAGGVSIVAGYRFRI